MPPPPFLRSVSLKNSRRAKRLATGSAFPHLPPVPSPRSLNPRGRFRPGFPSSPPASARARASGGHFGDSGGRRPGALFSRGFPSSL